MRALVVTSLLAVTLSACASAPGASSYGAETERLAADCAARGGVLVNTSDRSGHAQTDNVCRISGTTPARAPSAN